MRIMPTIISSLAMLASAACAFAQTGDVLVSGAIKPAEIRDISGGPFFEVCSTGSSIRAINPNGTVVCEVDDEGSGSGDNLGNHIATQNIQLGSHWLSGDGADEGLQVASNGDVRLSGDLELDDPDLRILKSGSDLRIEAEATSSSDFEVNANGTIAFTADDGIALEPGGLGTAVSVNNGTPSDSTVSLVVGGRLEVENFAPGSSTTVCRTASNVLADCSSSVVYKEGISDMEWGIQTVQQMRPVQFTWKDRNEQDFGFIAEEMAGVDRRFVTYHSDGSVMGVKYRHLVAVLVKALQDQQIQIDELRRQIAAQAVHEASK